MLAWEHAGGFSLDASIRIAAHDRAGLERLLRYCARPPFALERLEWRSAGAEGEVVYHLPRPAPDGRTVVRLSPLEFLGRLAALLPPPRVHRHRYHGVLAPNSPLRPLVTASAGAKSGAPLPRSAARSPAQEPIPPRRRVSSRWAALLARIYDVFPLSCPHCGATLRLVAFLTDPFSTHRILSHIGEPTRPPDLHPPRGPPELEFDLDAGPGFDQTPSFDPAAPEPIPALHFDQTRSW